MRMTTRPQTKTRIALLLAFVSLLLLLFTPQPIHAGEPPSLIVLVNHAPEDLILEAQGSQGSYEAYVRHRAWESSYTISHYNLEEIEAQSLVIRYGGQRFELPIDLKAWQSKDAYYAFQDQHTSHDVIYTLDLEAQTLRPGKLPWRAPLLIGVKLALIIVLEALLFLAFGFRNKRSWLIFLLLNLCTEGLFFFYLSTYSPIQYPSFVPAILRLIVTVIEITVLTVTLKEHKGSWRAPLFAVAANLATYLVGTLLLSNLPI